MNDLLSSIGLLPLKPLIGALLLPPVSWVALLLLGQWMRRRRPISGMLLVGLSLCSLWFSGCRVSADWLTQRWLKPPPALEPEQFAQLRRDLPERKSALVVLGAGRQPYAPEYADPALTTIGLERLHYALFLSRRLSLPVLYSGGVGWSETGEVSEAAAAARMALRDYGRNLRWLEDQSRDTRGNARLSMPLLAEAGITDIVLVTHAWHMPRALRAFHEAAAAQGLRLHITPAPLGQAPRLPLSWLDWVPTDDGLYSVRTLLREGLGLLVGA